MLTQIGLGRVKNNLAWASSPSNPVIQQQPTQNSGCFLLEEWNDSLETAGCINDVQGLNLLIWTPASQVLDVNANLMIELMDSVGLRWKWNLRLCRFYRSHIQTPWQLLWLLLMLAHVGEYEPSHDLGDVPSSDGVS